MTNDELLFFDRMPGMLPVYRQLSETLQDRFPGTQVQVHASQITFRARYGYAFVSLRRMKGCPKVFFILTFGLGRRLDSPRIAMAVEPYPNRWTHHMVITSAEQLDGEVMGWLREAYEFAQTK